MRISMRFARDVIIAGRKYRAQIRYQTDDKQLRQQAWGIQSEEVLRMLLPYGAEVYEKDLVTLNNKCYVCTCTRIYPGHVEAIFRRCAK